MSEDTFHIEFSSKELAQIEKKKEFESIYRKFVPEEETSIDESSISYDGEKGSYFASFFNTDSSNIDLLISQLEAAGASDVLATAWYDSVGEQAFFVKIDGELL